MIRSLPPALPTVGPNASFGLCDMDAPGPKCSQGIFSPGRLAILHLDGRVVLAVLAIYILASLFADYNAGSLGDVWATLSSFLIPCCHLATVTVIVPFAWKQQDWDQGAFAIFRGLILVAVATEASAACIVLVDIWFIRMATHASPVYAHLMVAYLSIVGPAMMVLGGLIAARASAMEEKEAMSQEAMIAKTRLLQSQLHPHVLFNALNGLAELIHRDPPAAELSVKHLSDLLRRILSASEFATFPLGEERALVENYLFLEGLRLGNRLRLQWDWDSSLDTVEVPPLLLQPLVENAIKHGIAPQRAGGDLIVRAQRQGADLNLEVWNTGAPHAPGPSAGIGIRNLKARLGLHFGASAVFSIKVSGNGTLAAIHLPEMGTLLQ